MFLLIPDAFAISRPSRSTFTFHYVSTYTHSAAAARLCFLIYIPLCFYLYAGKLYDVYEEYAFTFHYVSTYTSGSIMQTGVSLIYIPLCFYLYLTEFLVLSGLRLFTFHYVSTYTRMKQQIYQLRSDLHSTMFLLIPSL